MKPIRTLGTLAVTAAAALGMAASASAADPTGDYAQFKHCPYTNTNVRQCVYSDTNGGAIKLGSSNVPIPSNKHIILQGGIRTSGGVTSWFDAVGADTLSKTPLDVPGGLVSMVSDNWFFGPLLDAFNWAISFANGVTATAEKVGPVQFSLGNILSGSGTGVQLPVRVKLDNAFLGDNCYIGSAAAPITFNLTTGTTTQAPPLTGVRGTQTFNDDFSVATVSGISLVDNTFEAPEATNCGNTVFDRWLVTLAVNAKIGLSADPGESQAVMNGSSKLGSRSAVAASAS